jgi:DNA-binding CsgD family transcriptional regulator
MPTAAPLPIAADDEAELRRWVRSRQLPAVLVQRARILLLAAEGTANTEIAERVGVSRPTVIACRRRYVRRGLGGRRRSAASAAARSFRSRSPRHRPGWAHPLVDPAGRPRARRQPRHRGQGLARARHPALAGRDLQVLHRSRAGGQGPRRRRVVSASARAGGGAVCGREVPDPGVGAHPAASPRLARAARAARPRLRHGTTTLFAALEVATGRITNQCQPRHRHTEFAAFLKQVARTYPRRQLHVICDNYATHKHPAVRGWLAKHARVRLHFTPTSASWWNMVEVFFSIIDRQALRRGDFPSVDDLAATIGR